MNNLLTILGTAAAILLSAVVISAAAIISERRRQQALDDWFRNRDPEFTERPGDEHD